jgi:hypothetical protein
MIPRSQSRGLALFAIISLLAGCEPQPDGESRVRVGWNVSAEPSHVFGLDDEAEGTYFVSVSGVAPARSGAWYVADGGTRKVVRILLDGNYGKTIGRVGDGPGELRTISNLWMDHENRLAVFDARAQRLTTFDTLGSVVSTKRIAAPRRLVSLARLDNGQLVGWTGSEVIAAPVGAWVRDTVAVYSISMDGVAEERIAGVPGAISTQFEFRGDYGIRHSIQSPKPKIDRLMNCLVLAAGDTPELTVVNSSGSVVAKYTLPVGSVRTTSTHRAHEAAEVMGRAESKEDSISIRVLYQRLHMAEWLPLIDDLIVDQLGYIWVWLSPSAVQGSSSANAALILSGAGEHMGWLELPTRGRIHSIASDQLIVTEGGPRGEPLLKIYSLDRGDTQAPGVPAACR